MTNIWQIANIQYSTNTTCVEVALLDTECHDATFYIESYHARENAKKTSIRDRRIKKSEKEYEKKSK